MDDLFSLVDPTDVRWIFISHDDIDHYGNLHELMSTCPNATLVASWFLCQRLQADGLAFEPWRWRWVGDGETFEAGDRTLAAIRPPLYDSPTTRGLYDPTTGVYWASDCYAAPVERATEFVEQLDPQAWTEGFMAFQHWNSPWVSMLEADAFAASCRRIEQLRPSAIATAHGPTIEASLVQQAFALLRAVPTVAAPPQPNQLVLDQILSQMPVS